MGMFDEVICEYPLPGEPLPFIKPGHLFQTKDMDCDMSVYTITAGGRLIQTGRGFREPGPEGPFEVDYTGTLDFYSSNICGGYGKFRFTRDGEDSQSVDYRATFVDGRIVSLEETSREVAPALPSSDQNVGLHVEEYDGDDPPDTWVGSSLFVAWGGREAGEGYPCIVLAESEKMICVAGEDKELELIHKFQFGNTLFHNKADAMRREERRTAEWKSRKAYLQAKMDEKLAQTT